MSKQKVLIDEGCPITFETVIEKSILKFLKPIEMSNSTAFAIAFVIFFVSIILLMMLPLSFFLYTMLGALVILIITGIIDTCRLNNKNNKN